MKITVSSTSMMQPMFETLPCLENDVVPTQRANGLLEPATADEWAECDTTGPAPQFFLHPNTNSEPVLIADWDEIQAIATRHNRVNFVVFGFYYDGEHDWLRVWIKSHQRYLWTQRPTHMTYRSYAALTMSALSKIPPTWDGVLYPSPFCTKQSEPVTHNSVERNSRCNATFENTEAIVTDAAANEFGDLWFLVVVNSTFSQSIGHSKQVAAGSGWIRASSEV